jgi:hypothetical protein
MDFCRGAGRDRALNASAPAATKKKNKKAGNQPHAPGETKNRSQLRGAIIPISSVVDISRSNGS